MTSQLAALVAGHLSDRRRSLLAWGLPLGLMSAFIVAIFPSVEGALSKAVRSYPTGLKEAFGIGQLSNVEQYLQAEMLSLIVPLALGYLAVRAVASGLSGAAETGRLDVLLSAPLSRRRLCAAGFLATALELAGVLLITALLTAAGSLLSGAGLAAGPAAAGFANVWPGSASSSAASRCGPASSPAPSPACWWRCTWSTSSAASIRGCRGFATSPSSSTTATRSRPASNRSPSPASPPPRSSSPRSAPGCSSAATSPPEPGSGRSARWRRAPDAGQ